MSGISNGRTKVEVRLKWDPSAFGEPPRHLDIVAATYAREEPYGSPVYIVHTESRSPDGTVTMSRHSETGLGFGFVEVMVLELDRMAPSLARVVVGVAIHQDHGRMVFGDIANAQVVVVERYEELLADGFAQVADSTSATVAEFTRNESGQWEVCELIRGFDSDPPAFAEQMGSAR